MLRLPLKNHIEKGLGGSLSAIKVLGQSEIQKVIIPLLPQIVTQAHAHC